MRDFSKYVLVCAAIAAMAAPVSAGMVINGLGPELIQSNNNFNVAGQLPPAVNFIYSGGGDVTFNTAGTVSFYYRGSESGYKNTFSVTKNDATVFSYQETTKGLDPWKNNTNKLFLVTRSVIAGAKFSTIGVKFTTNGSGGANANPNQPGFGVFYNGDATAGPTFGDDLIGDYSEVFFGYDDQGRPTDDNHDDMVISATFTAGGGSTAVPEPASIAMWGIGALGMIFAGRKRRQMKLAA